MLVFGWNMHISDEDGTLFNISIVINKICLKMAKGFLKRTQMYLSKTKQYELYSTKINALLYLEDKL